MPRIRRTWPTLTAEPRPSIDRGRGRGGGVEAEPRPSVDRGRGRGGGVEAEPRPSVDRGRGRGGGVEAEPRPSIDRDRGRGGGVDEGRSDGGTAGSDTQRLAARGTVAIGGGDVIGELVVLDVT